MEKVTIVEMLFGLEMGKRQGGTITGTVIGEMSLG